MTLGKPARLSGIQRDVLALYRQCLREIAKKPEDTQPNFYAHVRAEFDKGRHLDKRDFGTIEFLLRRGRRRLETFADPGITNIH